MRSLGLVVVAAVLGSFVTSCQANTIKVRLRDFGNGNVDGLWLWRQNGSAYQRVCRIDVSNPFVAGGQEQVEYQQTCLDGRPSSPAWRASVKRLATNPTNATLTFLYQRFGAQAMHRASAFNRWGESARSSTTLTL
jgi:hypothetical protein